MFGWSEASPAPSSALTISQTPQTSIMEDHPMMTEHRHIIPEYSVKAAGSAGDGLNAALRREQWRDNPQQSVDEHVPVVHVFNSGRRSGPADVFKFDSFDRDRYTVNHRDLDGHHAVLERAAPTYHHAGHPGEECHDPEVFSPMSSTRSPHSSLSSSQVSFDSGHISFSPLRIKDSIEEQEENVLDTLPRLSVGGCEEGITEDHGLLAQQHHHLQQVVHHPPCHSHIPHHAQPHPYHNLQPGRQQHQLFLPSNPVGPGHSRPVSPNPCMQAPKPFPAHVTDAVVGHPRRRCLSDTDLSAGCQEEGRRRGRLPGQKTFATLQQMNMSSWKAGSLESDTNTQESPLDLSVRSSVSSTSGGLSVAVDTCGSTESISVKHHQSGGVGVRPKMRSNAERYSLDKPTSSQGESNKPLNCSLCGQIFSMSDRLAKHMASRHKSRSTDSNSSCGSNSGGTGNNNNGSNNNSNTKSYPCDVCKRSFARSDMLTRHQRLHTGARPYTCKMCGQVFSRSDHLSTHQRTHTGEKPYRCPSCPYAACRRDMITRHMRTHSRYDGQETASTSSMEASLFGSRSISVESNEAHPAVGVGPSAMDTDDDDRQ